MEKDDEVSGNGNSLDYGARIYDSRIGRWLSLDPLMGQYSHQSPYAGFNNNPIYFADPTGLEGDPPTKEITKPNGETGTVPKEATVSDDKRTVTFPNGTVHIWKTFEQGSDDGYYTEYQAPTSDDVKDNSSLANWFSKTWGNFDNFMKTGFPEWAYDDMKGNTPPHKSGAYGDGSTGEYGGIHFYADEGFGSALKTTQNHWVRLENGNYLPGMIAGGIGDPIIPHGKDVDDFGDMFDADGGHGQIALHMSNAVKVIVESIQTGAEIMNSMPKAKPRTSYDTLNRDELYKRYPNLNRNAATSDGLFIPLDSNNNPIDTIILKR